MTLLVAQRNRLFSAYERGVLSRMGLHIRFVALMRDAPDDSVVLSLCKSLPGWFCEQFESDLRENAETGYQNRWYSMGDLCSGNRVELNAGQRGDFFTRLRADIVSLLLSDSSAGDVTGFKV